MGKLYKRIVGLAKHCAVNLTWTMEGASDNSVGCASPRDTDSSSREEVGLQ